MDSIKEEVIKLLPVTIERRVRGEATVLEIFDIHLKAKKIMKVAGCRVSNGVIEKSQKARVIRNGDTVFEGEWPSDFKSSSACLRRNFRPPRYIPPPQEGYYGSWKGHGVWYEPGELF